MLSDPDMKGLGHQSDWCSTGVRLQIPVGAVLGSDVFLGARQGDSLKKTKHQRHFATCVAAVVADTQVLTISNSVVSCITTLQLVHPLLSFITKRLNHGFA